MPIIQSAIKRVRQEETRRKRNNVVRAKYKSMTKEFLELVKDGQIKEATALYPTIQKAIDMATKKNLLNKNTAGRRKSTLAKMISTK